jgi:hypothetical protein
LADGARAAGRSHIDGDDSGRADQRRLARPIEEAGFRPPCGAGWAVTVDGSI